jgi:hypothetical protein
MAKEQTPASAAMRSAIRQGPAPGSRWQHYRGGKYVVVGMVLRESDLSPVVVYRPDGPEDDVIWTRPLCEWQQRVCENGKGVDRFTQVET